MEDTKSIVDDLLQDVVKELLTLSESDIKMIRDGMEADRLRQQFLARAKVMQAICNKYNIECVKRRPR